MLRQSAFQDCKNLKRLRLNEGLEVLGTDDRPDGKYWCGVFRGSAVEDVFLPSTLRRIEYDTFAECKRLKSITLPERLECIGRNSFRGSALESVYLPNALNIIEDSMFFKCEKLKSVVFPDTLEKIGSFAFFRSGLENVKFPPSLR